MGKAALKVLLLEDDENQAFLVETFLSRHGISCQVAGTIREAAPLITHGRWDVFIMDLRLSDGSALDLFPLLARSPNARSKVVISTGRSKSDVDHSGPIDKVFEKPYSLHALVDYLKESQL